MRTSPGRLSDLALAPFRRALPLPKPSIRQSTPGRREVVPDVVAAVRRARALPRQRRDPHGHRGHEVRGLRYSIRRSRRTNGALTRALAEASEISTRCERRFFSEGRAVGGQTDRRRDAARPRTWAACRHRYTAENNNHAAEILQAASTNARRIRPRFGPQVVPDSQHGDRQK